MRTLSHSSLLQTALTGGRVGSLISDSSLHNCEKYKLPILWHLVMVARANTEGCFDPCFFFWPHHVARGILLCQRGIKPAPSVLKVWSLNHWTAREVPRGIFQKEGVRKSFLRMSYLS